MHDPRVGRFFARDPLSSKFPWNSPYAFSENRVIDSFELEGLEVVLFNEGKEAMMFDAGTDNDDRSALHIYAHGNPKSIFDDRNLDKNGIMIIFDVYKGTITNIVKSNLMSV